MFNFFSVSELITIVVLVTGLIFNYSKFTSLANETQKDLEKHMVNTDSRIKQLEIDFKTNAATTHAISASLQAISSQLNSLTARLDSLVTHLLSKEK